MTGSHNTGSSTESNMVGFRFKPTDEELVRYYLKEKVMGRLSPSRTVVDAEVYKVEPWHLPGVPPKHGVDEEAKVYYFFTRCNRKDKAGNKTDRSAGAGFWKVTCGDRPILDSHKRPIGLKRRLVFIHSRDKLNERVKNKSRNWIMQEYRLPSEKVGGWVLCRIKESNRRVLEERNEDGENSMGATTGPVEEKQLQESCSGGLYGWNNNVGSMANLFGEELSHCLEIWPGSSTPTTLNKWIH
ncbi:NAC domain-containing protein 78 isoform X4 [Cinnamomum micranthum f. kanehirae]|uniref:NAC domain-containing protein 78 isoform X4 n=1 Tax=Cinnamomum micranthum f. kanehirae TaxID=337451 RepID=A0A3S3NGG9_9MAGN|nr:NAC domain-containing protein 78 isoform X4 [Cinnamomum micranthum f. kanehirae]